MKCKTCESATKEIEKLRELLELALKEIEEHNLEYHHITTKKKIKRIKEALGK